MRTASAANSALGPRLWLVIVLLGLSGQIAWNVENTWFNAFVFDEITPESRPIAAMTAISATVATIATGLAGSVSDRLGRRKPFILCGYLLWAISTVVFPMSAWPSQVGIAIFLVIVADAVMTLFGATANDAAFNAWVTDVTSASNRGLVEGVLNTMPVIATMIGMGVSGLVIDRFGYDLFFAALGGLVLTMGLVGSLLLRESPTLRPAPTDGVFAQLRRVLAPRAIRSHARLFLVFTTLAIFSIGLQISYPYEVIYLNHTVGLSKGTVGVITALVAPVLLLFALPIGRLTDRGHGFAVALVGYPVAALGFVAFSLTSHVVWLGVFAVLKSIGFLMNIVFLTWHRNLLPPESRGAYQGVRLIFMVLAPMAIGSAIGSLLIQTLGTPATIDGVAGLLPPPHIYWASAAVVAASLIPVAILRFMPESAGADPDARGERLTQA
ncbi:MAG: MFS transporter [Beutenbergiaceae bacterium]